MRDEFVDFFDASERRLRHALTSAFGIETGHDATAEALAWAWQNWERVQKMDNSMGYLYRVGRSVAMRALEHDSSSVPAGSEVHAALWDLPSFEPNLAKFLAGLSEPQRVAVWMVHGMGFTHREVAELLECSRPTVATHVQRALLKLRHRLGVEDA